VVRLINLQPGLFSFQHRGKGNRVQGAGASGPAYQTSGKADLIRVSCG
jgi:hypothetical protein